MEQTKITKVKKITALQTYTGLSNYIYTIGNSNRLIVHKILDRQLFKDICLFNIEDRGTISMNKNDTSVFTKNETFYTDPREIESTLSKNILSRVNDIEKRIESLVELKNQELEYLERIQSQEHKDQEKINDFLDHVKSNIELKIKVQLNNEINQKN